MPNLADMLLKIGRFYSKFYGGASLPFRQIFNKINNLKKFLFVTSQKTQH